MIQLATSRAATLLATPLGMPIYWPPVNMEFLVHYVQILCSDSGHILIFGLGAFLKISRWSLINFFTSTTPTLPMETFHIRNESVSPFNSFTLGKGHKYQNIPR